MLIIVTGDLIKRDFIEIYVKLISKHITNKRYIIFNKKHEPVFSTDLCKLLFHQQNQNINKIEQIKFDILDISKDSVGLLVAYNIGDNYDVSENYNFSYTRKISTEKYA